MNLFYDSLNHWIFHCSTWYGLEVAVVAIPILIATDTRQWTCVDLCGTSVGDRDELGQAGRRLEDADLMTRLTERHRKQFHFLCILLGRPPSRSG